MYFRNFDGLFIFALLSMACSCRSGPLATCLTRMTSWQRMCTCTASLKVLSLTIALPLVVLVAHWNSHPASCCERMFANPCVLAVVGSQQQACRVAFLKRAETCSIHADKPFSITT